MSTPKQKAASPGQGQKAAQQTNFSPNTNPIDAMLSRLEGVKRTGNGIWLARCPAHQDKSPSLSIREADDNKVLIHCFAGCSAHEIVSAVGLEITDLFPPRPADPSYVGKPERRPFPAADILRAIGFETLVVGCAASAMLEGEPFTQVDRDRLMLAVSRIQSALDAGGLNHG
jgi:hypothetical protein